MPRSGWLFLVCVCAAGAALGAVPRPPAEAILRGALDIIPADDPFPIRRVRATDDRLPLLLKELEAGPVVQMSRPEFEARVRAAGRASAQVKHGPRILDANFTAELEGGDLTGTAEFGVLNASGAGALLPLDPLKLAVNGAKWAQGGEAVMAVLSTSPITSAPFVWVSGEGRRVLQFRWSLAGTAEPGERRFELRVPACPTTALQLDLPANQVPTTSADVLLTGPFEVPGKPARRAWNLRFGGRSKLEFAVRTGGAPSTVATAALVAKYELNPGQLSATFEYDLRPTRGSVGEWVFMADPGLRVTEVVTNNRAGWVVDPPATPNGPRRVRVSLRQPGPGGKVLINAVAPLPDLSRPPDAPLPVVRPLGAVLESESVELRLAPGLKIDSWAPGDYRLVDAALSPTGVAEQTRVVSLVGTLLPTGTDEVFRRMPSVRTSAPDVEFTALERLEWQLRVSHSVLVARVRVHVLRGPLFQLTVRPPPGFTLDRNSAGIDELIAHIDAPTPAGQVIELARPLLASQSAELRLEFRGASTKLGEAVPFPAFAVAGVTERAGWLSIVADPVWSVRSAPGAGATPAGLWGWFTTDAPRDARAIYSFRAKEPDGFVTLVPARPKISAQAVVSLDAPGTRWVATTRLALSVQKGALPTLTVFVPGPRTPERSWKLLDSSNSVTGATVVSPELLEMVPLFVPVDVLAGAAGARSRGAVEGTLWVLQLARPLTETAVLETTAPGPALGDTAVSIPIPRVLGASQTTKADVVPAFKDRVTVEVTGDSVRVGAVSRATSSSSSVSDAYLLTAVSAPDDVVVAFGGTVRDSSGGTLPIVLPPGAEVRGVCVGGRWLNPAAFGTHGPDETLHIPVLAGSSVHFEVRYRLPPTTGWPTRSVTSPVPTVPGDPPVRRWWSFASGVLPGWPAYPGDAVMDSPPLLGGPLVSDGPELVTRSDDEWVRVGSVRAADALAVSAVALVSALGWFVAQRRRPRGALVLASAVVGALVITELGPPWWARVAWPVLCMAVVALGGVLAHLSIRRRSGELVVAGVLVSGVALHSVSAFAQQSPPVTVLIVPGADGSEEIIAPRAVLDRLDAVAYPQLPAPALTSATYQVRADESGAKVTARFVVHALRSSDNVVPLPLGDARLERVTVGGAPAFPVVRADGYAVPLPGSGRHEIEARFAVTATVSGSEREVRFSVPEIADTKLSAVLPGTAAQPHAAGRIGRQVVARAGENATVEAELGAVRSVQLRWREGAGGSAVVKVREGCVWDVTEAGAELNAAYLVRVEQGAVNGLRFDVPAELEVLRVAVRSTDLLTAPLALRDWTLGQEQAGARPLQIDFQTPTSGRFLVVLECSPRKPLTQRPVLRFPRVAFGSVKGETEAVYGLRASRVTVKEVVRGGVIDFPADALRDFAAVPDLKLDPNKPVRAFRLVPGAIAELRPDLHAGELPAVRTVTTWHVGPHRADVTGTVMWTARESVAFLEFSVANVNVLEVRGPDVVSWNQTGARVQVWLRSGTKEDTIEWTGTTVPAPPGKTPAPLSFDPTHPKIAHATLVSDEVRVRPIDGWALIADRVRGWQSLPASGGELRFRTDSAAQGLRVQMSPRSPSR
ncbi:hypothetical protein VT84_01665 [Gemmata sp. SH-PL17]|uniref:hypothetical protein n=1 Tax=Gemmata sp. SH-PL17 TaxID=1630693 RepID=UPI00078BDCE3|nr:hypothetical protein [Gemmata sp. SH-PL17]AMV23089.1 hypothetical protein VT84_01665 [Gemmata sp. SH-PL17]